MNIRVIMIGIIALLVASVFSILVFRELDTGQDARDTAPPDPLTATPQQLSQ
ncbi:MAG: hypothetical protein QHC90_21045 [Shinella sp.]|nr:hypothetical protein [Shinella sp.]